MQQSLVFPNRQIRRVSCSLVDVLLAALATVLLGASGTLQMLGSDDARAAGLMGSDGRR